MYSNEWYERNKESIKAAKKRYYEKQKLAGNTSNVRRQSVSLEKQLLWGAKSRAKRKGFEFDIDETDIVIPETCPVLGVKLECKTGGHGAGPNSPTLDRVDTTKGYVKGNVAVISWKANRIKSDATPEEIACILNYMQKSLDNSAKHDIMY